jgi:pimeloyl-ACP methyl ester carboxylesterase
MSRSRLLLGAAAALAGAAALRSRSRAAPPPLPNPLGGRELEYRWRGWRIAGAVQGEGPPVLLVHAIHAAAWSWEWRRTVGPLARGRRVFALDLLGFGRSERPNVEYSAELYASLITDFARDIVGEPCALVANSLAAAHAIVAAGRAAEQFPVLVLVQPTGMTRLVGPNPVAEPIGRFIRSAGAGDGAFRALTSRPSIRHFLKRSYDDARQVTDDVVEVHHAVARQPGARFAPAAFVGFRLNADVRPVVPTIRQPTLLVWGAQPATNPLSERDAFVRARPDWETLLVDGAADLPHDEQPERFNPAVAGFLDRTWRGDRA